MAAALLRSRRLATPDAGVDETGVSGPGQNPLSAGVGVMRPPLLTVRSTAPRRLLMVDEDDDDDDDDDISGLTDDEASLS